jgi:uncharacterized protein YhaN
MTDDAERLKDKIKIIENNIDQIKEDISSLRNEFDKPSSDTQLCSLRAKQNEIESLMRRYKMEIENKLLTVFTELHDNSVDKNNLLMIETRKIMSNIADLDKRLTHQAECNSMLLKMVENQNSFNSKLINHLQEMNEKIKTCEGIPEPKLNEVRYKYRY